MPERQCWRAQAQDAGARLDVWLAAAAGLSRAAVQHLVQEGAVCRNGRPAAKNDRLADGDEVSLIRPDPAPTAAVAQDIPLDIVYEDAALLVVNKPKGMVVHPAPGNPDSTLVNALLWHCRGQLSGINGAIRPGIVHRIDKDTSGLLVAAKTDAAHRGLAAQLEGHRIRREYLAVCQGTFAQLEGTVDAPIARDQVQRKRMCCPAPQDGRPARHALTHWQVLAQQDGFALVRCRLETGRTHQIRVHMAHIGHPLAGDALYGGKKPLPGLQGQCLHAVRLQFTHPLTGQPMAFTAPLPEWFTAVLARLRLPVPQPPYTD